MQIGEKISSWMSENCKNPQYIAGEMKRHLGKPKYPLKRLQDILDGEIVPEDKKEVEAFARIMEVSEEYLTNNKKDYPPSKKDRETAVTSIFRIQSRGEALQEYLKSHKINIIGYVAAGETDIAYDDAGLPVGASIDYPLPSCVPDNNAYGLIIQGDSMFPCLPEGTRVIVCPNEKAKNGDICIVRLKKDNKVYIKQITFQKSDRILESFNPVHTPMTEDEANIIFCHPVKVVFLK